MSMGLTTRSPAYDWRIKSVGIWSLVFADKHGKVTFWVEPGWYRYHRSDDGVLSLIPIRGWRLLLHRLFWGFSHLEDAR